MKRLTPSEQKALLYVIFACGFVFAISDIAILVAKTI
jgi:hypothetical protein